MPETPKRILVVEDNPSDVVIIKTALQRLKFELEVQFVSDGQLAIDYLSGKRPYGDRTSYPLPHLILLDLELPRVSGFEVLEWVRTEPNLRFTPIVILATSNLNRDIQRAYAFGANSFITKPSDLNKLSRDLEAAFDHWLFHPGKTTRAAGDSPPGPEEQPPTAKAG